ncbi:MAG TPA: carboxypeptidase regulatory-like domain-containing protein [Candidatus Sulfotelmatobacter sp.]|nr:carboxypeptidase regulatory-like domain-containing protein [Candidatus Sulfotelmatobacter sp.]
MGLYALSPYRGPARALAICMLLAGLSVSVQSQDAELTASLRGGVRDSQGKPVAGANIHLVGNEASQEQKTRSDAQGNYVFPGLRAGLYTLRAEMSGYNSTEISSLFLAAKEAKSVDLVLEPQKSLAFQSKSPLFFDEPRFAVAGVTDTTSLGGHGSDTLVRTREALAKETVSLGGSAAPVDAAEKEKSLRERVQREPQSFEANHLLGKALDNDGKANDAIPYLERASRLKANDYESAYDLALAEAHAGNYQQTRDRAQALLARHDTAELHDLLGDVQEKLGQPLEAVREYQQAVALDPREPYVFDWGSELLLHHAPEPALEVFAKGNQLYPRSVRMLIGLGAAEFARGSYDQGVERISEASDLNPRDSMPYLFLGKMQSGAPASEKIIEKLQRFVAQQPESAEANYYYAVSLWKMRERAQEANGTAEIESLLERAVRLNPSFASAYLQLGILHFEQRDYPQAIVDYQLAIHAEPKMQEAHYRLAQAYRQASEASQADAELKLCDQLAKESAEQVERERHEIRQFVYILRDQPPSRIP